MGKSLPADAGDVSSGSISSLGKSHIPKKTKTLSSSWIVVQLEKAWRGTQDPAQPKTDKSTCFKKCLNRLRKSNTFLTSLKIHPRTTKPTSNTQHQPTRKTFLPTVASVLRPHDRMRDGKTDCKRMKSYREMIFPFFNW